MPIDGAIYTSKAEHINGECIEVDNVEPINDSCSA